MPHADTDESCRNLAMFDTSLCWCLGDFHNPSGPTSVTCAEPQISPHYPNSFPLSSQLSFTTTALLLASDKHGRDGSVFFMAEDKFVDRSATQPVSFALMIPPFPLLILRLAPSRAKWLLLQRSLRPLQSQTTTFLLRFSGRFFETEGAW